MLKKQGESRSIPFATEISGAEKARWKVGDLNHLNRTSPPEPFEGLVVVPTAVIERLQSGVPASSSGRGFAQTIH